MNRKKHNQFKRARAMIKSNLSKHGVVFTISLNRTYFFNRMNPHAKTCVQPLTESLFDPDSKMFNTMRFNWKFFPVVALKDAFCNFDKLYIHDVGYQLNDVTWTQAIEDSLHKANEYLGDVTPRFRMNCGIVFCLADTVMTQEKIEQILAMDKQFTVWDEDREIRTSQEIAADEKALIERLEGLV